MTRVKICGITNLADALACVEAGADALGFIFVENTPRFVTPELVAPIVRRLPPFVTPVGVFWDHPTGHIKAVTEACGLRALQFHGDEKPEDLEGFSVPVIKTIKLMSGLAGSPAPARPLGDVAAVISATVARYSAVAAGILFDSAVRWSEGETRESVEWRLIATMGAMAPRDARVPVILSGGLTPDNVATAVDIVKPYAVDVNSGVEAKPGRKDRDKVRRFIAAARAAA
jgi:phosphoribosylanthranilate isomerase